MIDKNDKLRTNMRTLIYFSAPHLEVARTVRKIIERYTYELTFKNLTYTFDGEGNPEILDELVFLKLMRDWFEGSMSAWPNATIKLQGEGGSQPDFLIFYVGNSRVDPDFPDDRGFIEITVSPSFYIEHRKHLERAFLHATQALHACSGYITPALSGISNLKQYALAKRYQLLDISDPMCVSIDLGDKIPGVNWFNYIPPNMANAISSDLSNHIFKKLTNGALIIKTTRDPILEDRNRLEDISSFRRISLNFYERGLLNIPKKCIYFVNDGGLADPDAQEQWHTRFIQK